MPGPRSVEITGTALADTLGVSTGQVSNWKGEGMPFRDKNGRPVYVVRDVVRWLRDQAKKESRSDQPDKAIEEARKLRAQADVAEMERDERAGLLVRRDAVEKAQMAENVRARAILMAIPGTYGQELADALGVTVRQTSKSLDAIVRQVLETLASEDDDELEAAA
jgi:phage terminase Nu1 subunit (DNA packaging protein)